MFEKKNIKIRRINIDENGNVTFKLKDITIPASSEIFIVSEVIKNLKENLVGIKIVEEKIKKIFTKKELPKESVKEFNKFNKQNTIHYYRYTDKDISYILFNNNRNNVRKLIFDICVFKNIIALSTHNNN